LILLHRHFDGPACTHKNLQMHRLILLKLLANIWKKIILLPPSYILLYICSPSFASSNSLIGVRSN